MTEQSGPADPSGQSGSQQNQPGSQQSRPGGQGDGRQGRGNQGRGSQGPDIMGDLQRWFIRQSAKNMRKEIGGQVRQTLSGRKDSSDVWDVATTEVPPEAGESPECQWCPICRAARRMRESGPGLGDQLHGASDAVAAAVQEAMNTLDGFLNRGGGSSQSRPGGWTGPPPPGWSGAESPGSTGRGSASDSAGQPSRPAQPSRPPADESDPWHSATADAGDETGSGTGAAPADPGER
jgi:hypothetical protein